MAFNIYEFHAYLAERKPWARMDVGSPDIPPDDRIIEALREAAGKTEYSTYKGDRALVEAIAELHGVEPSEVLPVPGGKFGVIASVYTRKRLGVIEPYWPAYRLIASVTGAELVTVSSTTLEKGWEIESYNLDGIDTLIVNFPNNPTGAVPSGARDIVEDALDRGLRVVSDEVYRDLVYADRSFSILDYGLENTVLIHSFSKTFSIPGYRIGYVIASRDIIREVARYIQASYTGLPKPIQAAALKALSLRDEIVDTVKSIYMQRIRAFRSHAKGILDFKEPDGGIYIFARTKPIVDDVSLVYRLADYGVGVFPGTAFGSSYRGFLRFTLSVPPEVIPAVMDAVRQAINDVYSGQE